MAQLAELRVACVGSGIMGGLLVKRLVGAGAVPAAHVVCSDTDAEKLAALAASTGVGTAGNNVEAVRGAQVVLLAVPPPATLPVLTEVAQALEPGALVVSVAAGVTLAAMRQVVPAGVHLARVMPNTPSEVGQGMNSYVCEGSTPAEHKALLHALLGVLGGSLEIDEAVLNATCALLAVGPTYLFPLAGQLMDSCQAAGLSSEQARAATGQLFRGVGAMLADTDRSPDDLLNMISMQPMDADTARSVIARAYETALAKLKELETKLSGQT